MLGVTEIANRVGLHKSTVSRILATFEQEHLVERDPETRRFRLGLGLIAVAGPLLAELEERRVAYPGAARTHRTTGETSALMVWNGAESMCVEQIASRHQIKHTTPLGARYNDALSASVQVFLAAEPPNVSAPCSAAAPSRYPAWTTTASRLPGRLKEVIEPRLGHQLRRDVHRRSGRRRPRLRPPRRHRGLRPDSRAAVPGLAGHAAEPRRSLRHRGPAGHPAPGRRGPEAAPQRIGTARTSPRARDGPAPFALEGAGPPSYFLGG